MNDSELHEAQETKPRFRFNVQAFQLFGLALIALALPFTILILGLLDIRKNSKQSGPSTTQETSPTISEAPGLRAALDSIAESKLTVPVLDDGIRRFSFVLKKSDSSTVESALRSALDGVGAFGVDASKNHAEKFIARVSIEKALEFDRTLADLGPSAKPSASIDSHETSSINYEITLLRE